MVATPDRPTLDPETPLDDRRETMADDRAGHDHVDGHDAGRPPAFAVRRGPLITPALLLIRGYQRALSPLLPPSCRFHPTCSDYGYEAIARYGIFKGGWLTAWRILRCNPFGRGGFDPVP